MSAFCSVNIDSGEENISNIVILTVTNCKNKQTNNKTTAVVLCSFTMNVNEHCN